MRNFGVVLAMLILLVVTAPLVSSVELDRDGEKGQTVFFLLGMLNDFASQSAVDERVEHFYCGERAEAAVFHKYLVKFAHEQSLNPDIRRFEFQGCLVDFMSRDLSEALNSVYGHSITDTAVYHDGQLRGYGPRPIKRDVVLEAPREHRLAYLCGAYFRFGEDATFRFYRDRQHAKTALIMDLLESLDCEVYVIARDEFPHEPRIGFRPTEEVMDWCARMPGSDR